MVARGILALFFIIFSFNACAETSYGKVVVVNRDVVMLHDLFPETSADDIVLGSAPSPGSEYVLGPRQIEQIASRYQVLPSQVPASGILVKSPGFRIGDKIIIDAIKAGAAGAGLPDHVDIDLIGFKPILIRGNGRPDIRVKTANYSPESHYIVAVLSLKFPGRKTVDLNVKGNLRVLKPVAVAAHPLKRGQVLKASDVTRRWTDGGSPGADSDNPESFIGKLASQDLKAGQIISANAVAEPLAVEKNKELTLFIVLPGVKFQIQGTALAGGRIGSVIPVLNPESHKVLDARIVGKQLAVVVSADPADAGLSANRTGTTRYSTYYSNRLSK